MLEKLTSTKVLRSYFGFGILVVLFASITLSPTYHECQADDREHRSYYPEKDFNLSDDIVTFIRCEITAVDENEGFVVGLFTLALFVATALLWFGAEKTARHRLRGYVAVEFDAPGVNIKWSTGLITIRIKNVGATPININDIVFNHKRIQSLPTYPTYDLLGNKPQKLVLAPGQEHFQFKRITEIESDNPIHYLFGYIDYSDVWGKEWRTGYARWFKREREDRSLYASDQKFNERMNLVPIDVPWWNYDRNRKRSEEIEVKARTSA